MQQLLDPLLILALGLNFLALGASRIRAVIDAVALQGIILGSLPLFMHLDLGDTRKILLVIGTIGLKGFVLPAFLLHAMREAEIKHEVTPFIGFLTS
jgi:hydrogenase-4 component E